MSYTILLPLAYLTFMSFLAIGMTLLDKRRAERGAWRIKERTLLLTAALGGSLAMFLTMKRSRHKTQHKKFMLGIPLIIALQITTAFLIWRLL